MSELIERLERAGRALEPAWSETRAGAALDGMRRRRHRRWLWRTGALALALGALLSLRAPRDARLVRFADHSTARLLDGDSVLEPGEAAADRVVAKLERGGARFEVVRDPGRRFRVEAGAVAVEVLGTVFTVERAGERSRVAVERGRVQVSFPGGERLLGAGESGWFPPDDEVGVLFGAADRARLEHAPERALAPLRAVVEAHAGDARAPLAAFTLGRLYLELGRRAEAADAFARARTLAPDGPLAADARAREQALRK
jgi:transmembrane sensor